MSKWNMVVDVEKCDNCRVCFIAVKDEHNGNDFPGYAAAQPPQGHKWLDIVRKERGDYPLVEARFMPVMCNHCDDAPCMKAAKNDAVRKRPDGIVIIDPEKAKGQKQIVDACPYGSISWNEEKQLPQHWIFDAHLLDAGWTKTRAEQACPTSALQSMKVSDAEMAKIAAAQGLEVLKPELGTKPRVYYKNLHLMTQCFAGATLVHHVNGIEECAAGVDVILSQSGREIGRTKTDTFGEFKFDRLAPGSGPYRIEASGASGRASVDFDLGADSRYLGVLTLK